MITIIARRLVRADKVDEYKALALELAEKSRAEEGNISYTLNERADEPRMLTFIECWKDQEAIKAHGATEHFTRILPQLAALCEERLPVEQYITVG